MNTIKNTVNCYIKPYIQPFERVLALRELSALAAQEPVPYQNGTISRHHFLLDAAAPVGLLQQRLAYWEEIGAANNGNGHEFTRQLRFEATGQVSKGRFAPEILKEVLPFNGSIPKPNRRSLRYGSHGIHEYRGKFFPQLVRSLLNIAGAQPGAKILDPMCGSGTTLVEAAMLGCRAFGLDMNPLSVLVSRVKCDILQVPPAEIEQFWQLFKRDFASAENCPDAYFKTIDHKNAAYLADWFAPEVLHQLGQIMFVIEKTGPPVFTDFLKVTLSNLLRRVSWQKDSDLRVRLDKTKIFPDDLRAVFLHETETALKSILALTLEIAPEHLGDAQISLGDARDFSTYPDLLAGKTDCIITSPPYATALPYLDTDRLSLCFFNLISRPEHRQTDYRMIGNREITAGRYKNYWADFRKNQDKLSPETVGLIEKIERLNAAHEVGFRRKNLPALLAKYFLDMRSVLDAGFHALKPGGMAFFVVGNNHTIAGGEKVEIPTDHLLGQLAEKSGFRWTESLSMEMLVSRDIFSKNTGSAETILFFQKP